MMIFALAVAATGFQCAYPASAAPHDPTILVLRRSVGALTDQARYRYVLLGENTTGLAASMLVSGKDLITGEPYVGSRTIVINKLTGAFKLTSLSVPADGAAEIVTGTCSPL